MENDNVRWKQRYSNFCLALNQLEKFVCKDSLSELEQQSLIQSFEYTYELGWNVLKDFLVFQGSQNILEFRDASIEAFRTGIITNGQVWLNMLNHRNKTAQDYDLETANNIIDAIKKEYFLLFKELKHSLASRL